MTMCQWGIKNQEPSLMRHLVYSFTKKENTQVTGVSTRHCGLDPQSSHKECKENKARNN